jgi:nucleoside-diphosphate-sugar epimerase
MRVLVVGSTGVLGQNVIPRLLERGHEVRGVVRQEQKCLPLRILGAEPVMGDILVPESLVSAATGCECVLHLATAVPRPGTSPNWGLNDRIRREGTRNLLAAATSAGARRYIQQSITFLYGDHADALIDESTPLNPAPVIQSASDMEALVNESDLAWSILRGGSFYGPGTGKDDEWRAAARENRLRVAGDGGTYLSLIHVVDMARAVAAAAESAPAHSVYNVVDDSPVTERELLRYVAAKTGAPEPLTGAESSPWSLRVSNARIKAELAWKPAYPSYRSGLV